MPYSPPASSARWWSTESTPCPGVHRHRRKFAARISLRGRWVRLGLYDSEWEAARVARRARDGDYARLPRKALERLAAAMGLTPELLLELAA